MEDPQILIVFFWGMGAGVILMALIVVVAAIIVDD
jgi:hypothetical protein